MVGHTHFVMQTIWKGKNQTFERVKRLVFRLNLDFCILCLNIVLQLVGYLVIL